MIDSKQNKKADMTLTFLICDLVIIIRGNTDNFEKKISYR